jgi:hypothetical protein
MNGTVAPSSSKATAADTWSGRAEISPAMMRAMEAAVRASAAIRIS